MLKGRVTNGSQFLDSTRRVAAAGTAMDPEVISRLLIRKERDESVAALSTHEREVLGWVAQGLFITERAVAKHISNISTELNLLPTAADNRRVLAYLDR